MNRFVLFLFLSIPFAYGFAEAKAPSTLRSDSVLHITGSFLGYCNNLEYFNDYREGILHLGASTNLALTYSPAGPLSFSLGVYLRKAFGDEPFMTDARPVFRALYAQGAYELIIGALVSENRHNLPDAILWEQFDYEQGLEEGLQIRFNGDAFELDFWAASNLLNTSEQREHLDVGLYLGKKLGKLTVRGMTLWDHYGGQQYAVEGDPMRDNVTAGLGMDFLHRTGGKLDAIGFKAFALGSATTRDRGDDPVHKGWGFFIRPYVTFCDFTTSVQLYQGSGFTTWRGNPLYHTEEPYYFFEVKRSKSFGPEVSFDWGVRFDFVETRPKDYFDHTEHQIWLRLRTAIDHTLF